MAILLTLDRPLPEAAQRDIGAIIDNVDRLNEILTAAASQKPGFGVGPMTRLVASELSVDFAAARKILHALDNLHEFRQQLHDTTQVLDFLRRRLSSSLSEKLTKHADDFIKLVDIYNNDHPFLISTKAKRLSYLHENLYQEGEVLTDIRPVFNEDGSTIMEMVIAHSLVLNSYSRGYRSERVHFAMDATDVLRLRDLCDRAIKKADTLKKCLGGNQWDVRVLNEGDNGA